MLKRRSLLKILFPGSLGISPLAKGLKASEVDLISPVKKLENEKSHIVQKNERIYLPKKPVDGQTILFVIENDTIFKPAKVMSQKHLILGENDELIFDAFANILMVFDQKHKNWYLG